MKDDLFQEIIDPHKSSFSKGKEDGRKAALQAGYDGGYHLGKLKALEIGIELGYMHSICTKVLHDIDNKSTNQGEEYRTNPTIEKRRKRILDLIDGIKAFPKPETIFRKSHRKEDKDGDLMEEIPQTDCGVNEMNADVDIAATMQLLRAKFKTLLVQFDRSHLRLKTVMDDCTTFHDPINDNYVHEGEANRNTNNRMEEW